MNLTVRRADTPDLLAAVRSVCEQRHYLRRYPDPRSLPFGYVLMVDDMTAASDGDPWAILLFKKPQHHRQNGYSLCAGASGLGSGGVNPERRG